MVAEYVEAATAGDDAGAFLGQFHEDIGLCLIYIVRGNVCAGVMNWMKSASQFFFCPFSFSIPLAVRLNLLLRESKRALSQ